MLNIYRVSFIGHREISCFQKVENQLEAVIYDLLRNKNYVEFYIGRNGEFDILAASIIKRAQRALGTHNNTLTLVLPYPVKDMEYYEKYYDEVVIPLSSKTHYKVAITNRNEWMVENSDLLVAYVERDSGGAAQCVKYAEEMGKKVYNLINKKDIY